VGMPDSLLGETVRLFVVHPAAASVKEALQTFCQKELPIHQQPKQICFLDVLPKLESGKIDRQALQSLPSS